MTGVRERLEQSRRVRRYEVLTARCGDYNRTAVDEAVHELLSSLDGRASLIRPGSTVLVKPNMLSDRHPEEGVTTHPAVLEAAVRFAQRAGARVVVGDSPPRHNCTVRYGGSGRRRVLPR